MTDVLKMSRKAFTVSIVALTVAWSIGLSALLAPLASSAAASGSLIKASLPAVYYMGSDGKRYVFPNEATYKSWYADFGGVMTVTDAELASIPIGGNVTMKPGVKMVKITTDPKVYAVDAHGCLRWIKTEAAAVALYGSAWNTMVLDIPDAFFTNYTVCADISGTADFNPAAVSAAATSINSDKGLASGATASGVSASKASDSPAGSTLPSGANGVTMLKLNVSNSGSSAVVLSSATIRRSGVGHADDFEAVYLYQGASRLTTGRSINSSTNDVSFSGLNVSVAAGGSVSLSLVADMADLGGDNAGNQNSLSLSALMVGSSSVSGLPVSGGTFSISGASVGEVTVEAGADPANVKAGAKQAKLAKFTLTASGEEDLDLHGISLFHGGSLSNSDLSNLKLKQGGLTLASVDGVSSKDLVVFSLSSPMFLEEGQTRTYEVYGDVAGGARSGDSIEFYVDESSDVRAVGRTYGYGVTVDALDFDSDDASFVEVEAGEFTIAFNGPASNDIGQGANDVELFNFSATAQANVEVRDTTLIVDCAGADDLDDIKIVDTASGTIVAGPASVDGCGDPLGFTETWNLSSGQTRTLKVTADIADDATVDSEVMVTLVAWSDNQVRNLDNSTYLDDADDFVPTTDIGGNAMTIKEATLDAAPSSTPISQTYIKGSQGVALGAWTLRAGDASAVEVSSIELDADVMSGCCADPNEIVQSVKLMKGSTQVGSSESLDSDGNVTFDNLDLTIAAGASVTLSVSGNLSSTIDTSYSVRFWMVDSIEANDPDGNNIEADVDDSYVNEMFIEEEGDVTVVLAPEDTDTEAGIVLGGSSNAVLAKYKLTAQFEPMKLVKAMVDVSDAAGVESLSLYDGSTLVGGPADPDGEGIVRFTGMNFAIPKDSSKTLTVKGMLSSVGGSSGVASGTDVTVTLVEDEYEFRGTSAGSSTVLDQDDDLFEDGDDGDDIEGEEKLLYKTKATISLVALPSNALVNDTRAAMRFSVAADSAGAFSFQEMHFTMTNGTVGTALCDSASSLRKIGGSGTNLDGSCDDDGDFDFSAGGDVDLDQEQTIAAGSTSTYELRLAFSGTDTDDSVSTLLESVGFTWSDNSDVNHDSEFMGSDDWEFDGTYLKVLPTDPQTLSR